MPFYVDDSVKDCLGISNYVNNNSNDINNNTDNDRRKNHGFCRKALNPPPFGFGCGGAGVEGTLVVVLSCNPVTATLMSPTASASPLLLRDSTQIVTTEVTTIGGVRGGGGRQSGIINDRSSLTNLSTPRYGVALACLGNSDCTRITRMGSRSALECTTSSGQNESRVDEGESMDTTLQFNGESPRNLHGDLTSIPAIMTLAVPDAMENELAGPFSQLCTKERVEQYRRLQSNKGAQELNRTCGPTKKKQTADVTTAEQSGGGRLLHFLNALRLPGGGGRKTMATTNARATVQAMGPGALNASGSSGSFRSRSTGSRRRRNLFPSSMGFSSLSSFDDQTLSASTLEPSFPSLQLGSAHFQPSSGSSVTSCTTKPQSTARSGLAVPPLIAEAASSSRTCDVLGKDDNNSGPLSLLDVAVQPLESPTTKGMTEFERISSPSSTIVTATPESDHDQANIVHPDSIHCFQSKIVPPPHVVSYQLSKNEREELGFLHCEYTCDCIDDVVATVCSSGDKHVANDCARDATDLDLFVDAISPPERPIVCVQIADGELCLGRDVLSHPLLVEALESLFIPVQCPPKKIPIHLHDSGLLPSKSGSRRSRRRSSSSNCRPMEYESCQTEFSFLRIDDSPDGSQRIGPLLVMHRKHSDPGLSLTRASLASAMIQVLRECRIAVPKYLSMVHDEEECASMENCIDELSMEGSACSLRNINSHRRCQTVYLGVTDAHLGEVEMAGLDGIYATKPGRIQKRNEGDEACWDSHQIRHATTTTRLLHITYDSKRLAFSVLCRYALQQASAIHTIFYQSNEERVAAMMEIARTPQTTVRVMPWQKFEDADMSSSSECTFGSNRSYESAASWDYDPPKRALRETPMRFVPMTAYQATRINRLVHLNRFNEAVHLLSPRQGLILMDAVHRMATQKSWFDVVHVPILLGWMSVCKHVHPRTQEFQKEFLSDPLELAERKAYCYGEVEHQPRSDNYDDTDREEYYR